MMNDFISREAVIKAVDDYTLTNCPKYMHDWATNLKRAILEDVKSDIDNIPAADVQPIKYGWISTSERLPEKFENVLLSTNGGLVEEGFYFETTEFHAIWKGVVTHGTYWDDEITAWMPLPKPYHTESEDK